MQIIHLSLGRCVRVGAWGLIAACCALVMGTQVAWPWRIGCTALMLLTGGLLWHRYLRRRPALLRLYPDTGLSCTLADGREIPVRRLTIGIVNPWLVSARLQGADGQPHDLFVPGCSLDQAAHWQLRRAMLAFREHEGGAAASAARPETVQSERRGT